MLMCMLYDKPGDVTPAGFIDSDCNNDKCTRENYAHEIELSKKTTHTTVLTLC